MSRVYLSPPHVFGEEQRFVADAFASNWIAPLGPHVDAFEREIQDAVGVPFAVALSSGTAGLHLAMELLGVGPGDTVVCPALTFIASANPVCYQRATPVFVDSDDTWTMDPGLLEEALKAGDAAGKRAKAVISVDLYGQCADHDAIAGVCDRYGVPLVEDAAEALGSTYKGRMAGGFGRLGILSFNGNKIITTSGGGMLVSHDRELVDTARSLATQARDPVAHYQHSRIGYNYRLSNVLAAVGRAQLVSLAQRVARRREIFNRYVDGLQSLPGVQFMPEAAYGRSNRWLTCLLIDPQAFGTDREAVRVALEAEDIEARPTWKPMHMQPVFAACPMFGGRVSEQVFRTGLCLPSGSSLGESDQARVIATIRGMYRA